MTLSQLQKEQAEWSARNFGPHPTWHPQLGMVEELGELAHSHLKSAQGIRGTPEEHKAAKVDAVADYMIFFADVCNCEEMDMETAVQIASESPFSKFADRHHPHECILSAMESTANRSYYRAIAHLMGYCRHEGIDFESAIFSTWERVKQRNWRVDPLCATTEPGGNT